MTKVLHRSFLLAFVLAGSVASCSIPSGFTTADRGQIQARAKSWADALVAGDVEALVAIYEPDAVLMPPGSVPVIGVEAIGSLYSTKPDVTNVKLFISELNGHGPLAYVVGRYRITMRIPDQEELSVDEGTYVEVWRRHGRSGWLIARDIRHPTPVPSAAFDPAPPVPEPEPEPE